MRSLTRISVMSPRLSPSPPLSRMPSIRCIEPMPSAPAYFPETGDLPAWRLRCVFNVRGPYGEGRFKGTTARDTERRTVLFVPKPLDDLPGYAYACDIMRDQFDIALFTAHTIDCPASIRDSVLTRQAEFLQDASRHKRPSLTWALPITRSPYKRTVHRAGRLTPLAPSATINTMLLRVFVGHTGMVTALVLILKI